MKTVFFSILFAMGMLFASSAFAKTVHYELTATRGQVNLSGKKPVDFALMLNGSIPAPTLEFTEGDDAEIVVKNEIPGEELSLHWHGILLPNEMDGVPYVTTPTIRNGQSYTFRFKIKQNGTYWYHSHTNVQEQKGLFGAFIIHPKSESIHADKDIVVMLNDWTDENAVDVLKNLKKDGDYYLYKKNTVRSWFGAIQAGKLGTYLENEWTRMGGMDLSDVGYDAFLINGKNGTQLTVAHPGEKIRLRIINAGASTYFNVSLGQALMKVISADGMDIHPVLAKKLLMGMAETYDVLFTVPENKNYELKATAQDGTGSASGWIGWGEKVFAPVEPMPDLYASMDHKNHGGAHEGAHGASGGGQSTTESHSASNHSGHLEHAEHEMHAHHHVTAQEMTVDQIRSIDKTAFPKDAPVHDLKLVLGGDMSRYIWYINGKTMKEDMNIDVNEGEIVRIQFVNDTMMHHPMHLHGHFFRVLNEAGEYAPLKHTVDVPPHGSRVIEFRANEPGRWMLHCHNLYHMKSGMGRLINYVSYEPRHEVSGLTHEEMKNDPHMHDEWYTYGLAEAASNHAQGYFRLSQTWNQLEARIEGRNTAGKNFSFSEPWEAEGDLFYRRWLGNYLNLVGGATLFGEEVSAIAGFSYRLPFLIESQLMINHHGKFRLDLEKKFQWTSKIFTDVDFTWRPDQPHDLGKAAEWEISLMYGPNWNWAGGLMLTDESLGVGLQVQF
jgi:FtsP/CotA-like multicopper oxidase with cupredoxin domain